MTSEEPKQADQAAVSPGSSPAQSGSGDDSASDAIEAKIDVKAARPVALSSGDIPTEDRWDDSEIDAAVDVLERPSQMPPSTRHRASQPSEPDEPGSPRERQPPSLSASAVEKSKRASGDVSISPRPERTAADGPASMRVPPRPPALPLPPVPRLKPNTAPTQVAASASGESVEVDQYVERPLVQVPMPQVPAPPVPMPQVPMLQVDRSPEEPEEVTRYFERTESTVPTQQASHDEREADEATQFFERVSLDSTGGEPLRDVDDKTQFFERPNSSAPNTGETPGATLHGPSTSSWVPSRASSVPLGVGVALMSAETTEPPPVVSRKPISQPAIPPRPKFTPPRPATPGVSDGGLAGAADKPPVGSMPELPALPAEFPTRPVQEGRVTASPEVEPQSERSEGGARGDIEPAAQGLTGVTAFSIAPRPGTAGFEEEAWLDPIAVRAGRRLLRAAAACALAALALALVDGFYAHRAAADHPVWWLLALACAGLLMPLSLLVAVVVTGLSVLLHPDSAPSLHHLPRRLRPTDIRRQARLAVILAIAPVAASCWIVLVARAALPLLGSNAAPATVGTLLAAVAVGFGLIIAAPVLAVARYFGVRLRPNPPDPVRWGIVGLVVGIAPLAAAIATGPTSGAGSALAIFGVFRRPELDLRLPGMLVLLALAGYLVPTHFRGVRWVWLLLLALLPFGLTVRAATRGLENRAVALAVERGAPVSRMMLTALRKATDRDHDGFSRYFGGGDCDEHNRSRNPGADDTPGNGIDEDCSGSDASVPNARSVPATPLELMRERRGVIPENLNLILIIVDTMRSDVLHHSKHIAPRLDELADASVTLQNAYSPASYTGKSVGPILIGKHSSETNRDFGHFAAFSRKDTFLQQRLSAAGIRTLSVQSYWYFYQTTYGFDRGFDIVDTAASVGSGYVEGDRSTTGEKLTERVLLQLDRQENTSGRFFLWTQYTDPHAEYVAHSGFDFGIDSLAKYHGEVAFVDQQIGRILDFVRSKPWGARTAIMVTSDHGEAFGEHGMIRHGFELWEPLVRVPLVVHVPGVEPKVIRSRRSLIDVVPTILDLMQVAMPGGVGTDFLSGRSMLPEVLGIEGSDVQRPLLVDMANGPFTAERQAYIDGDDKLITAMARPTGLFNLATDPDEKHDLLDDTALRERIVAEYRGFKKTMHVVEVRPKQ